MKLTNRDIEIINHLERSGGATIEQIASLFFPSYVRASVRLKILEENKLIKSAIQPTLGKLVYYKNKMPSYHTLCINEILIALKGKYKTFKRNMDIGKSEVDLVTVLNNNKYLIFEIEIFNKVSKSKLDYISNTIQGNIDGDIWIVSQWHSNTREKAVAYKGRVKIEEIKKISNYY